MRRLAVLVACVLACACRSHSDATTSPPVASSVQSGAGPTARAGDASPAGSGAAAGTAKERWQGTYKSTSGELYIPPDWKNVRWNVKDTPAGIGEGAMVLTVDPSSGRALGSLDGALGPALIDGLVSEGKLTATVTRKEAADKGFTGTLLGAIHGDQAEGTMSLSPGEVSAVRHATFTLSRGGEASSH